MKFMIENNNNQLLQEESKITKAMALDTSKGILEQQWSMLGCQPDEIVSQFSSYLHLVTEWYHVNERRNRGMD